MLPPKAKTKAPVIRSASEKSSLISAYRESGQSMSQFCRENNLAISSFSAWLSRESDAIALNEVSPREHHGNFVELEPVEQNMPHTESELAVRTPFEQVLKLQLGKTLTLELSWRER